MQALDWNILLALMIGIAVGAYVGRHILAAFAQLERELRE